MSLYYETLVIKPKLDPTDLNKMDDTLSGRFHRLAKRFGEGITGSIGLGSGIAIGQKLVDKLLNPLKEVQEAIEKTLNMSDSLATNAKEFNTSAGELAKLQAFGKSVGLDAEGVNLLVRKFQGKVAEAIADPHADSAVRNFVGQKDTAQAFLTFMENLSALGKADKNKQIAVEQNVFGERTRGAAEDFANADFKAIAELLKGFDVDKLDKSLAAMEKVKAQENRFSAARNLGDINAKGDAILANPNIATRRNEIEQIKLDLENANLKAFDQVAALQKSLDALFADFQKESVPAFKDMAGSLAGGVEWLRQIAKSPALRDVKGLSGGFTGHVGD